MDLKKFTELKAKVEELQRQAERAAGALLQIQAQMKKEFGCGSLEEARTMLAKLEKEERKVGEEYEVSLADFEERWKDKLGDDP